MSAETPEARPRNIHQIRREKIAAAIQAWQEDEPSDPDRPFGAADALVDCLNDEGLQVLPRTTSYARFRVEINGQFAPYAGQSREAGPLDADEAAEVFLIAALGAEETGAECAIVVRPATDAELVAHVWDHITGGGL